MARTTYLAPGVYVEEVPSDQQPIAGVGTNTVGFIGLVENMITYAEPNPDYDPVLAKVVLNVKELTKRGKGVPPELNTKLTDRRNALKIQLDKDNRDLEKTKSDLKNLTDKMKAADEEIKGIQEKPASERSKEEQDKLRERRKQEKDSQGFDDRIKELEGSIAATKATIDGLDATLPGTAPAASGTAAQTGGAGASGEPAAPAPSSELLPYVLKTFKVRAASCDTKLCTNFSEYVRLFGPFSAYKSDPVRDEKDPDNSDKWTFLPIHPHHSALTHAVYGFFINGGTRCFVARVAKEEDIDRALEAFESIDELALIAAPGLDATKDKKDNWEKLITYAEDHENVFAILDCPEKVENEATGDVEVEQLSYTNPDNALPRPSKDAAFYFPYIEVIDPAKQLQDEDPARQVGVKYRGRTYVAPSGHIAGIYARTDEERGVHKAPANAVVRGALEVKYYISKPKQELLNPQGVNCIRIMNGTIAVWGARTIGGDKNSEWKYVSVRRLFLYLQKSIDEGTQWVVFEPNDPALWGKIRLNVSAFLTNVWRSGALFGLTPEEAFYVKCDAETNPPEVRDLGQVVTEIGVAIVRPAEFVIFRVTQATGLRRS